MDYSKYYTPTSIAHLLIKYLRISPPDKIVDICCGSCNLLTVAKKRWRNATLYGTDISEHCVDGVIFEKTDGRAYALEHQKEFELVLANPPFDYLETKKGYPQLFQGPFKNYSSSRLEIEMLISNLIMLKDDGTLLIIMPSSFVEGETYSSIRQILSKHYQIKDIIELDESTFGAARIHSYAIVIKNKICKNYLCNLMYAQKQGNSFELKHKKKIQSKFLIKGTWDGLECGDYNLFLDIKRGNISSASFMSNGQPILHTAKNEEVWCPSIRYVDENLSSNAYAECGDIIVSRIGKSAGRWCVYSGEKIPISDCLYRIKDSDGKIFQKINGKRYEFKLRGVATQYITMSDFKKWIGSL